MSCDITVQTPEGESVRLNWLRNPFGLVPWATDNYLHLIGEEPEPSLYAVINKHAYEDSEQVMKHTFRLRVEQYGNRLKKQSAYTLYFWFTVADYLSFIRPHERLLPWDGNRIVDGVFKREMGKYGIPMNLFTHTAFNLSFRGERFASLTEQYLDWYGELRKFADLLNVPGATYFCSN